MSMTGSPPCQRGSTRRRRAGGFGFCSGNFKNKSPLPPFNKGGTLRATRPVLKGGSSTWHLKMSDVTHTLPSPPCQRGPTRRRRAGGFGFCSGNFKSKSPLPPFDKGGTLRLTLTGLPPCQRGPTRRRRAGGFAFCSSNFTSKSPLPPFDKGGIRPGAQSKGVPLVKGGRHAAGVRGDLDSAQATSKANPPYPPLTRGEHSVRPLFFTPC